MIEAAQLLVDQAWAEIGLREEEIARHQAEVVRLPHLTTSLEAWIEQGSDPPASGKGPVESVVSAAASDTPDRVASLPDDAAPGTSSGARADRGRPPSRDAAAAEPASDPLASPSTPPTSPRVEISCDFWQLGDEHCQLHATVTATQVIARWRERQRGAEQLKLFEAVA